VATGRALAETVLVAWGAITTTAVGFAVGFRPAGTIAESLVALGLCIVFGFAFTWVFIVIGLMAGSAQAAQGMSLLVFPLTFVSSAYVPVDSMPAPLAWFAQHQPVTAMVDAVRAWAVEDPVATLGASAGTLTTRSLLWSAALIVLFAPLAVGRYRRP
jgi:ABC-type polysaccharide/polyol phosphate export permease